MAALDLPLRHTWVRCPEGRLVVRPTYGDGHEALNLSPDGVALQRDEVQVGVATAGDILVKFRDAVRPAVFEHTLVVNERTGLWVGDIEGTSGVDLAARPGRYIVTGWFDQIETPAALLVVLGVRAM